MDIQNSSTDSVERHAIGRHPIAQSLHSELHWGYSSSLGIKRRTTQISLNMISEELTQNTAGGQFRELQ